MNPFLKWYLIGAAFSLMIQIIFLLTSNRVKVSNIIGYILNTALSWGCVVILLCNALIETLEKFHLNKIVWESETYKKQQEKMRKAMRPHGK